MPTSVCMVNIVLNTTCVEARGGCVLEHFGHLNHIMFLQSSCANCPWRLFSWFDCVSLSEFWKSQHSILVLQMGQVLWSYQDSMSTSRFDHIYCTAFSTSFWFWPLFSLTYYKTIHVGLIWDCILACVWGGWRLRSLWLTGGLTPVNTEILNLEKTITEHELLYPRLNKSQPSLHFSKPEWRQAFHILYIHYIIRLCHGADPLISKPSSSLYMTHTQVMESSTQCP